MDDLAAARDHRFDIVTSRVLNAAPAAVFAAFADPQVLARWWGPKGFADTIHEFQFQVGGVWRHTLHGPDGRDHENEARFTVIEPDMRVEYDHNSGKRFTLNFRPAPGGKTLFSLGISFESAEAQRAARELVSRSNDENIDRLAAVLRQ
jgi:uncharacterized protein YndB with AHSA1/START domain